MLTCCDWCGAYCHCEKCDDHATAKRVDEMDNPMQHHIHACCDAHELYWLDASYWTEHEFCEEEGDNGCECHEKRGIGLIEVRALASFFNDAHSIGETVGPERAVEIFRQVHYRDCDTGALIRSRRLPRLTPDSNRVTRRCYEGLLTKRVLISAGITGAGPIGTEEEERGKKEEEM